VPQRTIELPAFLIDKHPVTNAQFEAFCRETGHAPRSYWPNGQCPPNLREHPVVCVNRADALAYCRWVGKRLPTEVEWEKAARGPDGRVFPWGDRFDPEACVWNPQRAAGALNTAPVGTHPRGASPHGVMDMVGNVAEWCADPAPPHGALRGGCWLTSEVINLRAAARNMNGFDNNAATFYGFRCAKEVG
jgi:formylglycine-generating enzyme required for sulfatase activity